MTTHTAGVSGPVLERLHALAGEAPELAEAAAHYGAVLPLIDAADLRAEPVSLTPEEVRKKMGTGLPLLQGLDLSFDISEARNLMLRLAMAVENLGEKKKTKARLIRETIEGRTLDIAEILLLITAGERDRIISGAKRLRLDSDLVVTLAEYTLRPVLREWQRRLTPLTAGSSWERGYCFICGAAPTLAELQENAQAKHLRCGQCGADWLFPRLRCASCGNEDHRSLGFLYSDNEQERIRLEFCDKCKGYIKVIASFTPISADALAVQDLATLHLDLIAQERGYSPPFAFPHSD